MVAVVLLGIVGSAVLVGAGSTARVDVTAEPSTGRDLDALSGPGGSTVMTEPPPAPEEGTERMIGTAGWWTALVAVAAAVAVLALFSTREQIVPPEDLVPDPLVYGPPEPVLRAPGEVQTLDRARVLTAVEDALARLGDDVEPRVAVRVAYATVAEGLGRSDLARHPSETEGEYLRRVLVTMGGGGGGLQRLTDLFAVARFSDDVVDEAMRAEALALLEDVRAAVARSTAAPIGAAPPGTR